MSAGGEHRDTHSWGLIKVCAFKEGLESTRALESGSERPKSETCISGCVTLGKSRSLQCLSFLNCKMGTMM